MEQDLILKQRLEPVMLDEQALCQHLFVVCNLLKLQYFRSVCKNQNDISESSFGAT